MLRYALLLFLGMAFFGSGTPVSKLVGQDFPPLLASGIRMALAALILVPIALLRLEGLFRLSRRDWGTVFLVALIGNLAFSLFMLYGMKMVSGVVGSVVMSTTPAVTAAAAILFLHEQVSRGKLLAIGLSLAGVFIINTTSGGGGGTDMTAMVLGSLLIFGAVCSEAAYTLLGKVAMSDMPPLKLASLSALLATCLFLPLALWQGWDFDWQKPQISDWAALGWWGAGTMALGSILWYGGVNQVPGHIAAAFMAVMPVSALVLSYLLLGEPFRWLHLAGFGTVFAGVLLIIREHMKMAKHS